MHSLHPHIMTFSWTQNQAMPVKVNRSLISIDGRVFNMNTHRFALASRRQRHARLLQLLPSDRDEFLPLAQFATHRHPGAIHAAEDARHRRIRGISARADAHQSVKVGKTGCIEHYPGAPDKALEASMKIGRFELVCIPGKVSGRDIQRTA
jgi:hypothetical protein